jgi:hypothetical protein
MSNVTPDQLQPQPPVYNAAPPQVTEPANKGSKPRWYRRGWVIAVASLLLGVMIGSAGAAADPKDSPEYHAVAQRLSDVRGRLQASQSDLSSTKTELARVAGDLPAREAALKKAQAAIDNREAALDGRAASVKAAEKAVAKRERAVGLAETEIANNTIPGDGIFQVGVDMKAGTYKTSGHRGCYYAVNADANGNRIKSNNITNGPAVVSVSDGEFFETSRCADFVLQ